MSFMGIEKDVENGDKLSPMYIALTCSKAYYDRVKSDFDSNAVTSRVNVETFKDCWTDVFYNKNDGLESKITIPETDKEYVEGIYIVWSITKRPETPWGEVDFLSPCLSKTYVGVVREEALQYYLPKTALDLQKQKLHFGLIKGEVNVL
jgi:hypothetical protein